MVGPARVRARRPFSDYARPKNRKGRPTAAQRVAAADKNYVAGRIAAAAVKALSELADQPFFLAVGFLKPYHTTSSPLSMPASGHRSLADY